jgi:mono/diheme cytochrome c family protein
VRQLICSAALLWAACLTSVLVAHRQTPTQTQTEIQTQPQMQIQTTVWSGVYTEAQAFKGEKVAETTCIGCHGSGLSGGDSGPKLVGDVFLANWSTQPVSELFGWIREAMPADAPGTLGKDDAAAVVAYILKLNKMPAGKQALSSDRDDLTHITITADKP